MPFEVWKTHMGTYRNEKTMEAFRNIYKKNGVASFWKGWQPKMVESFLKGGILMFAKEGIIRGCKSFGIGDVTSGLIGGFGGGVAQVSVLGPCTYLITAAVTGDSKISFYERTVMTYREKGIAGFYRGGTALMLRQGSNWASRQGITDVIRNMMKGDNKKKQLSIAEESIAGLIGGALSTWNQPFEVMRIEAQASAAKGLPPKNIIETTKLIVRENGVAGLFQGVLPRMGLCCAQTFFMVSVPYIMKAYGF